MGEPGIALGITILPPWWATSWFRLVTAAFILALLVSFYQLRLRQVAWQFNIRLEGRVAERMRIARDLHDTLLQSFQAVLLKICAVTYMLDDHLEAQKTLGTVVDLASEAIAEGRDTVQGLRSSTLVGNDLAQAFSILGTDLAANHGNQKAPDFRVKVLGTPRDLAPLLRDEIYRIACESLRNAFRHAHAAQIEVEIRYDRRQLRMLVWDNGKGIDPNVLSAGARSGHYGLPGMHERVKVVGGRLAVWSKPDCGTKVELTIPGSVAYAKTPSTGQ